jgi:hypothetical protein
MACSKGNGEPKRESEQTEIKEIDTDQQYKIDQDGKLIAEGVAIHHEVGDSEFDYVLVGSDPDQNGTSDRNAFGFHADELAQIPLPDTEADKKGD